MQQPGAGGPTVLGQPLEPGERVIWFRKHDYTMDKIIQIAIGVVLLFILIGIIWIVLGITMDGRRPQAHAITNRRLIVFGPKGKGPPQSYPLSHIVDLNSIRRKATNMGSGGGLMAMAAGAAINAAVNASANAQNKITKDFWARTETIDITFSNGQKVQVKCDDGYGPELGLMLARASLNREAENLPNAQEVLP